MNWMKNFDFEEEVIDNGYIYIYIIDSIGDQLPRAKVKAVLA